MLAAVLGLVEGAWQAMAKVGQEEIKARAEAAPETSQELVDFLAEFGDFSEADEAAEAEDFANFYDLVATPPAPAERKSKPQADPIEEPDGEVEVDAESAQTPQDGQEAQEAQAKASVRTENASDTPSETPDELTGLKQGMTFGPLPWASNQALPGSGSGKFATAQKSEAQGELGGSGNGTKLAGLGGFMAFKAKDDTSTTTAFATAPTTQAAVSDDETPASDADPDPAPAPAPTPNPEPTPAPAPAPTPNPDPTPAPTPLKAPTVMTSSTAPNAMISSTWVRAEMS